MASSALAGGDGLKDKAQGSTVMVLITSRQGAEDFVEYAENALKGRLKEGGLKVMNPEASEKVKKDRLLYEAIRNGNASAMAKISTEFGADVLIRGNLSVESRERFAGTWEALGSLDVRAIDMKTAEEIEALASDPMGTTENPAAMEDSSLSAKQTAVKKTVENVLAKMGISGEAVLSSLVTISPALYASFQSGAGVASDIEFSPDGRLMAVSGDRAVKLWDTGSKSFVKTLEGMKGKAAGLAFNKDGSLLSVASSSGNVYVWGVPDGALKLTIKAHSGGAWAVDFCPDGRTLATGGGDGAVRLWDLGSGTKTGEMGGHTEKVHSLAYDATGRYVMTASNDLTIRHWDANTKKEVRAFAEPMDRLFTAAFSADRSLIAYGAKTVEIDMMRNRREDKEYIRLRDAVSGRDIFTFEGHTADITSIAFFPGRRFIVSSALDRTVKIWDVEKRGEIATLEQGDKATAVGVSRDGSWLAAGGRDKAITVWKLK